jgi:hypothetical protein
MDVLRSSLRPLAACLAILCAAACSPDPGDPLDVDGDAAASFEVPVGAALQPWLIARGYEAMRAEPAPHPTAGPHGRVRTFFSPALVASLAGAGEHPRGAGAVKELYDGDDLRGWAVEVKVQDDSASGDGWYWYEVFGTDVDSEAVVDGTGAGGCTGCHGRGTDFVRAALPPP